MACRSASEACSSPWVTKVIFGAAVKLCSQHYIDSYCPPLTMLRTGWQAGPH